MSDVIKLETANGVTVVTLNRPDALNALSNELRTAITETFIELKNDTQTKVIILTGSGRAFSAGLDLKELGQKGMNSGATSSADLQAAVMGTGKPIIGAINGFAITGGFEIALMCDILVASTEAKFADTHVRMGVVPGWGLTQRLSRLIGTSRAKEISFTANYIDATTAERWGLVNRVLAPEALLPHCHALAAEICQADEMTLKTVHHLIDFGASNTLVEGMAREAMLSQGHKGDLTPETLEARRLRVQARGRNLTHADE